MIRTELTAAGIDDPDLRGAYLRCRTLNAAHGRTFFLATRLLAPDQRPPVHALYGFARYADDILDDFDPVLDTATRAARLQQLCDQLFSPDEHPSNPVLAAVRHTARRYDIHDQLFDDFLASMRMDLTITDYPDRAALNEYM
ncbi:MAG: squalene/phytoene synthase family protein, partial [Mycobacterium sp.]